MKKLLQYWLLLLGTLVLSQNAILVVGFQSLDLRFEAYAQLLVIPSLQAALLAIATRRSTLKDLLFLLAQGLSPRPMWLLLFADLFFVIFLTSWLHLYLASKGVAASYLVLRAAWKPEWARRERAWVLLAGIFLAGFSFDYVLHWMEPLAGYFFSSWPLLLQWIFFYGPLFFFSLFVIVRLQKAWSSRSPSSGILLEMAAALAWASMLVVVISYFNKPELVSPWPWLLKLAAAMFLSLAIGAVQQLFRKRRGSQG
ncbi:MAG: hypothetical protein HY645_14310 [Acidobacteria bacterium]|nr:hypothetical protein [Acidobacteriota bacterium]